jgi:hypothetical protein
MRSKAASTGQKGHRRPPPAAHSRLREQPPGRLLVSNGSIWDLPLGLMSDTVLGSFSTGNVAQACAAGTTPPAGRLGGCTGDRRTGLGVPGLPFAL